MNINIRKAHSLDLNFILSAYLKSFRNSIFAKAIANEIYYNYQQKLFKQKLETSTILVAVSSEDPNQIFSFVVCERFNEAVVVHYIYTKETYRKFKIAEELLKSVIKENDVVFYTHQNFKSDKLAKKFNAIYNPYLFLT